MSGTPDYLQAVLALAFVLGLLLVAAAALSRWRGRLPGLAADGRIAIVESRSLDQRNRLVLIRWDRCEHLLLVGQASAQLIGSRPAEPPAVAAEPAVTTAAPAAEP